MQNRRERKAKKRKLRPYIWVLIGLFLFASVSLGAGIGYTNHLLEGTPEWDPEVLLKTNESSIIYNEDGSVELTKLFGAENRTTVEIENVPEVVKDAFLATEDIRFYDHNGIDFRAFARAVYSNLTKGFGSEGASTITQQVVKGAFLSPEKTIKRKLQEVVLALELERNYTKDEIFEMYLNRIYFGHGAYGVEAAAQVYFNKSVDKLTLPEAAMLAGLPQRPNGYSPFNNREAAAERRAKVIGNMERYEMVSAKEAEKALQDQFRTLNTGNKSNDSINKVNYPHPYFIEHVIETLIETYGAQKVYNGGLRVYTTIDQDIQVAAEEAMNNEKNFPKAKKDDSGNQQPQGAAVILDPKTGYIKALVGGRGINHSEKRVLNRATQSKRQTGSTFKPVMAYAPAIDSKGFGAATVIDDAPVKYGKYEPKNYNNKFNGPTTIRAAAKDSVNVVAVKTLEKVGVDASLGYAKKMGLNLHENDKGLGLALGGLTYGITPLELAGAFGTFANEGLFIKPTVIVKVEDKRGKVLYEYKPKKTKVFKESTSHIMTDILRTVVSSGTGTNARFGSWQIAGKTGTTNDSKDIWFVGYTPELLGAVWVGHDQPKAMPREYGGTYPAKIWREIMQKAHKDKKVTKFPKATGVSWATVCKISGKKPSELCPDNHLVTDMFPSGKAPSGVCDLHVEVEICAETGLLPTEFCPETKTELFISKKASQAKLSYMEPEENCPLHGSDSGTGADPTKPSIPEEPGGGLPDNTPGNPSDSTDPNSGSNDAGGSSNNSGQTPSGYRVNNEGNRGSKTYSR